MFCEKCGKNIDDESAFCRYCGTQIKTVTKDTTINTGIKCLKCNSSNINIQREQTANIGIEHTNYYNTQKHHGLIYFCIIGWWIWIYKLMFSLMFLPFTILFGSSKRRKIGISNSINTNKTINKTVAVCQNCGYVWNVK